MSRLKSCLLFSRLLPLACVAATFVPVSYAPRAHAQASRLAQTANASLVGDALPAGVWNAGDWKLRIGHVLDTRNGREIAAAGKQALWHSPDCTALTIRYARAAENGSPSSASLAVTSARLLRFRTRGDSPDFLLIERETVLKQEIEGGEEDTPDLQMLAVEGKAASARQADGYAALFPAIGQPLAVFTLRSELPMNGSPSVPLLQQTRFQGVVMRLGYHFPLQVLPVGTTFRQALLVMRARPEAIGSIKGGRTERDRQVFDRAQRALGLDGNPPAYQVSAEWGTVKSTRYTLDMTAKENAAVTELSKADLPCDLPIRVMGLQARWAAACVELPVGMTSVPLDPGALRPRAIGVQEGIGYAAVNINDKPHRLFVGHPIVCDRPDVEIKVTRWEKAGLTVQLRSTQSQAVTVSMRVHPRLGFGRQTVVIPPQATVTRLLLWR